MPWEARKMGDDMKLRLEDLNRQIQVQRNVEMHAAMERARLETQRVELMSQMLVSSVQPPAVPTVVPMPPYRVVMQMLPPACTAKGGVVEEPRGRRKRKPAGLPTIAAMVEAILRETPGLRAPEIAAAIRKRWWPDLNTAAIRSLAWRMVRSGHLTQQDGHYRIKGAGHNGNHDGNSRAHWSELEK
jgi:hypothetical protein